MDSFKDKLALIITGAIASAVCFIMLRTLGGQNVQTLLPAFLTVTLLFSRIGLQKENSRLRFRIKELELRLMRLSDRDCTGQSNLAELQTEFDVILEAYPTKNKITVLKLVRKLTGLGLLDAKVMVESIPTIVKIGTTKDDAEDAKQRLEEAGALVRVVGQRL